MKTSIEQKLWGAFVGGLILLGFVGLVSWRSMTQLRADSQMIEHTHQVIEHLEKMFSIMTDAQNSHRGYALTGDKQFLEAFQLAVDTVDDEIRELAMLTADNDEQQTLLQPLPGLVNRLIERGHTMIAVRDSEGLEGAQRATLTGEGKRLHDEFRTLVDRLQQNEQRLLQEREERAQASARFARAVIAGGFIIAAFVVLLALAAMRRDFAGRRRAETLMRESEERFRTLANNMTTHAWMADATGHIFWYNQRWLDYTGTTLEAMEGWGWKKVHHPDHVDRVEKKIRHCFETGEPWDDTVPLRGTDGNYRWFLTRAVPIRDESGNLLRWFGTDTDVTEQREAQEALRQAAELGTIVQMLDLASVMVCDMDNRITRWNSGCQRLYGYSAKDAVGKLNQELLNTHFPEPVEDIFKMLLETGRWSGELRHRAADGRELAISSEWALWRDGDGHPAAVLKVNTDITERIHTEARIRKINTELEERVAERTKQLERKNRELETFTYSVSHDLKAPLRGIDGYSRLLLEDYGSKLDDEGRKFLENVRRGTVQMGQLIDDLLSYSRLERRDFQKESVDVNKLVSSLLAEKDDEIKKRGATLKVEVADAKVSADSQGLVMSVRNLVDNAIKFTRDVPSPEIHITGRINPQSYVLSVRDNGAGFDMKFHDRIFEIFQRLHRAEDFSGTGVGLAIVRKAMERMGGRAWAESELGKGATFHLEMQR